MSQVYGEAGDAVFGAGWRARRVKPRGAERFNLSPAPNVRGPQASQLGEHAEDPAPLGGVQLDQVSMQRSAA